jgi:hypothetical protein
MLCLHHQIPPLRRYVTGSLHSEHHDHDYTLFSSARSLTDSSGQRVILGVTGVEIQVQSACYLAFPKSTGLTHFARIYVWKPQGQCRPLMNTAPQPITRTTLAGFFYDHSESEESHTKGHLTQCWALTHEDKQMQEFLRSILRSDTQGLMYSSNHLQGSLPARWCFKKIKPHKEPEASFKTTSRSNAGHPKF